MPPKKPTTSAVKTTRSKSTKEASEAEGQESIVPEKKVKKPARKVKTAKEEPQENQEEEIINKKKTAKKPTAKEEAENVTNTRKKKILEEKTEDVKSTKKKATKASSSKQKQTQEDDTSNEKENGTKKVTKSKKKAVDEAATSSTVTKATRKPQKKVEENNQESGSDSEVEETITTKKVTKRRAPPKADKDQPNSKAPRMNATITDWKNINFQCASKNAKGESSNFHITSWNVDGLRAWLKKGGLEIIEYDKPDIFCIQETKCSSEKLPDEVKEIDGYETFWCSSDKEGYAGVGVVTKVKPLNVTYGIDSEEHDVEGRCITVEYEKFFLINVYVPNAGRKLVTLPKRLDWNELFKNHVKELDKKKPVIVCGDMNVAHMEIDLANPKTNTKNAGFTVEERDGMTDFLEDGYVDTFRQLYPDKEKAYTFWTYMANARSKNVGWRLDYFIISKRLMDEVCDNLIHNSVLGSDHCPLSLHLNI